MAAAAIFQPPVNVVNLSAQPPVTPQSPLHSPPIQVVAAVQRDLPPAPVVGFMAYGEDADGEDGASGCTVAMVHPPPRELPPLPINSDDEHGAELSEQAGALGNEIYDQIAPTTGHAVADPLTLIASGPQQQTAMDISPSIASPNTTTTYAINTTITSTNPVILPVVPLDSNHELETSLSTVSASTSSPSSSPVAVSKVAPPTMTTTPDSENNNHAEPATIPTTTTTSSSEPAYMNTTESVAIAAAAAAAEVIGAALEENNNRRMSTEKAMLENGHGNKAVEEVDGVPKSPTRAHNMPAAVGGAAAAAPVPAALSTGAIAKEGNSSANAHLERVYNNLYDNQEMVVMMMTANLGRPDDGFDPTTAGLQLSPEQQQLLYDIPVSPPAGE